MILDTLENAARYEALNRHFSAAFDWLRRADPSNLAPGRHEGDGDHLYFVVSNAEGKGREAVKLEAHRTYIDIQCTVQGCDEIGWRPIAECRSPVAPFDETRDVVLFADAPKSWTVVPAGTFAIYFPEDAHAPMAGQGPIHKFIAKVSMDG